MKIKVGIGYDIHRLVHGRKLILGGVVISHDKGLDGHSDGDVLLHAISDAIFGGLGLQDIGHWFPDDDDAIKNIDSKEILKFAKQCLIDANGQISNIDATIIAQEPYLAKYINDIKYEISRILDIPMSDIGIKAKTNEKIGEIGRGEAMAVIATCCLIIH